MELFKLFATIGLDTDEFDQKVKESASKGKSFASGLKSSMASAAFSFNHVVQAGKSVFGAVRSIYDKTLKVGLNYNRQIENYTTNFKVMLGSYEAASKKVEEIRQMASKTPFGIADLSDATQTLLAFQVPATKTNKILQMLGDVALGNKTKLSGLALVFGQVSSAGKLTGQDLMQFINQGFNPLNYIAERTGESMEDLRDRMSKGAVTVAEVEQAFVDATSEGGQFYKGMEEASKTLDGMWSTLKDDATAMLGTIAKPFTNLLKSDVLPALSGALSKIGEALDKVFGSSESLKESLFGTGEDPGEGKVETTQSWMDRLLATWSDGQKEDKEIVDSFVASFTANTKVIIAALEARKAELEAAGEDTTELEENLKKLNEYDAQITELIEKRKNKNLTQEDINLLKDVTEAKTALEESLMANAGMTSATEAAKGLSESVSPIAAFIEGIGNAVASAIENWDAYAGTVRTLAEAFAAFKIGSLFSTKLGLIAMVITMAVKGFQDLKDKIESGEIEVPEWIELLASAFTTISDAIDFVITKMKELFGLIDSRAPSSDGDGGEGGKGAWFPEPNESGDGTRDDPEAPVEQPRGAGRNRTVDGDEETQALRNAADEINRLGESSGKAAESTEGMDDALQKNKESLDEGTKSQDKNAASDAPKDQLPSETLGEFEGRVSSASESAGALGAANQGASEASDKVKTSMVGAAGATAKAKSAIDQLQRAAIGIAGRLNSVEIKSTYYVTPTVTPHAEGAVFKRATLFPTGDLVGEGSQAEAVLPVNTLWREMGARLDATLKQNKMEKGMDYDALYDVIADAIKHYAPNLYANGRTIAGVLAGDNARAIADRKRKISQGYVGR